MGTNIIPRTLIFIYLITVSCICHHTSIIQKHTKLNGKRIPWYCKFSRFFKNSQQTRFKLGDISVIKPVCCLSSNYHFVYESSYSLPMIFSPLLNMFCCWIPVCRDTTSLALLLSRVGQLDHLRSWALWSSHPSNGGVNSFQHTLSVWFAVNFALCFGTGWFFLYLQLFCLTYSMLIKDCKNLRPYLQKMLKKGNGWEEGNWKTSHLKNKK